MNVLHETGELNLTVYELLNVHVQLLSASYLLHNMLLSN